MCQITRNRLPLHGQIERVPLPHMIAGYHLGVVLSMDFFCVNGHIFFHTKSDNIDFVSAQYWTCWLLRTIMAGLKIVQNKYSGRYFNITDYHAENDIDKAVLKYVLTSDILHIYRRFEHVGSIKRSTRAIKERCRSTCQSVPYQCFTTLMIQ